MSSLPSSAIRLSDAELMQLAIEQARAAEAAGEVPVGAVVVAPDGVTVLGRGWNRVIQDSDPTAHCEVVAMREAGRALGNYRADGMHAGVHARAVCDVCGRDSPTRALDGSLYAARDSKAGACGSALSVMNHPALNHRVEVVEGVLAEECGAMLSDFFRRRRANASTV